MILFLDDLINKRKGVDGAMTVLTSYFGTSTSMDNLTQNNIVFNTKVTDPLNSFSSSTFTCKFNGLFVIQAGIGFAAFNATGTTNPITLDVVITPFGSAPFLVSLDADVSSVGSARLMFLRGVNTFELKDGSTIQFQCGNYSGATQTALNNRGTYFQILGIRGD